MFTSISGAGLGMYITLLAGLVSYIFKIDLDQGTLTEAVYNVIMAIGGIIWFIGQIKRKDLNWGIFRTQKGE